MYTSLCFILPFLVALSDSVGNPVPCLMYLWKYAKLRDAGSYTVSQKREDCAAVLFAR